MGTTRTTPMHSEAARRAASRLGLTLGKPNLEVFADTLLELARANPRLLAVTSDSRGSGKLGPFGQALPRQIVEVGIAEQNLVGIAAGLSAANFRVFAVSPACFLTARALEQIKNDVAYSDHPVALVGISAGVSYGALGSTHHSLHDLAALRAIHNLTLIVPADAAETRAAVRYAASAPHPVYLRFGKSPLYGLPAPPTEKTLLSARTLREGKDVAFIATGETVIHAVLAAEELNETTGLDSTVLSVPTIRPLDTASILQAARTARGVVTVEEHSIHGGLGEAVATLLATAQLPRPLHLCAFPDEDTVTGSQPDIFRHYGLTAEGLAATAHELLTKK